MKKLLVLVGFCLLGACAAAPLPGNKEPMSVDDFAAETGDVGLVKSGFYDSGIGCYMYNLDDNYHSETELASGALGSRRSSVAMMSAFFGSSGNTNAYQVADFGQGVLAFPLNTNTVYYPTLFARSSVAQTSCSGSNRFATWTVMVCTSDRITCKNSISANPNANQPANFTPLGTVKWKVQCANPDVYSGSVVLISTFGTTFATQVGVNPQWLGACECGGSCPSQ